MFEQEIESSQNNLSTDLNLATGHDSPYGLTAIPTASFSSVESSGLSSIEEDSISEVMEMFEQAQLESSISLTAPLAVSLAAVDSPDLVALAFDAASDHVLTGQTNVTFTIANRGLTSAEEFEVGLYYSDNETIGDSDDNLLQTITIEGIGTGERVTQTVQLQLPIALLNNRAQNDDLTGLGPDYISDSLDYLGLVIDSNNVITEVDETNNANQGKGLDVDEITYFPWDIDGNGTVAPTDAIFIINRLGQSVPSADPRADLDGDGQVAPTDAISAINRLGYKINPTARTPVIQAALVQDTGISPSDAITSQLAFSGNLADPTAVSSFRASIGHLSTDISSILGVDGRFSLERAQLETLFGETIPDGEQTLTLVAADADGNTLTQFSFNFILDTQSPELTIDSPVTQLPLDEGSRLRGNINDLGSGFVTVNYQFDNGEIRPITVNSFGDFDDELELMGLDNGSHDLMLMATDVAGNTTMTPLAVTVDIGTIEMVTVMPGQQLEIALTDIIANSDGATFSVESDEMLPEGMLESDGTLIFYPIPDEVGTYSFTVVAETETEILRQKFSLAVVADPITTTRLSGVIQNIDKEPIEGVVIELGSLQTTTAADGSFFLETTEAVFPDDTLLIRGETVTGDITYPFVAEKLSLLLGREPFTGINNNVTRPIFLPPIDMANAVMVDPMVDTMVTTEAIPGAQVFVEAGTLQSADGENFTGAASITEVPNELTPAALPNNLIPDIVVTIQPAEMVFTTPAPLSLPNEAGYPPGTVLDLWSINPNTGQFDNVGQGRVSDDGSVIETVSGGIRNSSWHFFAPPPDVPEDPNENDRNEEDGCDDCKGSGAFTSEVEFHSGAVLETHDLVTYQSLGVTRGLTLNYDSLRADPRPILHFGYDNVQPDPNRRLVAELIVRQEDFEYQVPGFAGGFGLDGGEHFWSIPENGGRIDAALQADLRTLGSGLYDYELTTGLLRLNNGTFSGSTTTNQGQFLHINTINSPFGNGWGLVGLHEIIENADGSVLIVDGDGSEMLFTVDSESGYESPAGDFSTLEKLGDGTFQRTMTDQTIYSFNSQNKLSVMRDRNDNEVRYLYDNGGKLTKIIDPVGLETTFTYAGNRVTAITDPSNRVTRLKYNNAGNLIEITDPDGTKRKWEYDNNRHITAEIDKRGNREETFYDFAGRADRAVLKDGSEIEVEPVQVQGLYRPTETLDPLNAPVATALGPVEASYVDANGNQITHLLDQMGQIVASFDEVGQLPTVERNEDNLITRRTNARGNITLFTYDEQGNLLTVEDELSGGNSIIGSIGQPGEVDTFHFEGQAGQRIYFDGLSDNFNLSGQLLSPTGNSLLTINLGSNRAPLTLLETGTYEFIIDPTGATTGDYRFRFIDLGTTTEIELGTNISGKLNPGNETEAYRFTGSAGQRLSFDSLLSTFNSSRWRLYSPANQQLVNQFISSNFTTILPGDGEYTLILDGSSNEPIDYSFQVNDISDPIVPISGLTGLRTGTISAGEQDIFTFTAPAGLRIYLDSVDVDNDPINILVRDPDNNNVIFQNASSDRDSFVLNRSGTYTVTVQGSNSSSTGDYSFRFLPLNEEATVLGLNTVETATLAAENTTMYRFEGTAGQKLYFDGLVGNNSIRAQLLSPTNNSLFNVNITSDFAPFNLIESGTYLLVIDGDQDVETEYSFRLLDISETSVLELDTTITGTLDPGIASQVYQFNGTDGQRLYFDSLVTGFNSNRWLLYSPGNQNLTNNFISSDFETTLTGDGLYTLILDGTNTTETVDFNFQVIDTTPTPVELTLGTVIDDAIDAPGQQDIYTFEGTAGQRLYFDGLDASSSISARLFSPSGGSLFNVRTDGDQAPLTITETGTYQLVLDVSGDSTGDYSFRLSDVGSAPVLELDTAITGTLDPGVESQIYRFNGSNGQRLYFDSLVTGFNSNRWLLYSPGNQNLINNFISSDFEATLTGDGLYTLIFDGSNTTEPVDYSFQVIDTTPTPVELTLGTFIDDAIDAPGQQDTYTFEGTAGQRLYFDGLDASSSISAQLFSPSGGSLFNRRTDGDQAPLTITETGTYQLVLDVSGDTTGDYSFRLSSIADEDELEFDTAISGTLDPGVTSKVYQFMGTAGQRLYFDNLSEERFGGTWNLYNPLNQSIGGTSLGFDFEATLVTDGLYTLILDGTNTTETVDFNFRVVDAVSTITELTLGTLVSDTIDAPGKENIYTFEGTAGQRIYFDGQETANFNLFAQLLSPTDSSLFNLRTDNDSNVITLLESGTYQLIVNPSGETTGNYSFNLFDLADVPELNFNQTYTGTLSPGVESELYQFTGQAGQRLFLDDLGSGNGGTWRLYGLSNQIISNNSLGFDFEVVLPTDGTYVFVLDGSNQNPVNYTFRALIPDANTQELDLTAATGGGRRQFTYDPVFNQLTSITDELGRQTLFDIDPNNGNISSMTQVIGAVGGDDDLVTQFTYTNQGLADLITDPLGRITDNDYDALGRLIKITFAKGTVDEASQQFEYDTRGNETAIIDENGNRTEFQYDALNRIIKITEADPDGAGVLTSPITTYTYDAEGNLINTTDALNQTTQNQYDELNRLIETIDELNQTTTYSYDDAGNLTSIVDQLNHITQNNYDKRNRLIETIDPDSGVTTFGYDADNNLTSVIDPIDNETTFIHDARNRVIREIDPLGNATQYQYDAVDNLIIKIDRNNRRTDFTYDDIDRLIKETWVGTSQEINYSYDKLSNLTSVVDQYSSLAFTYDNRDRLLSVDNTGTPNAPEVVLNYTYDDVGNILSVTDTINGVVSGTNNYTYDALYRLIELTQTGNGVSDKRVDFAYNPLGQFTSIDRYSDLAGTQLVNSTTYTYDALNRLTNLAHSDGTNDVAFYDYAYDAASRITRITDVDGVTNYTYDDRDQLIGAENSNVNKPDESYSYDANGNRTSSGIHGDDYQTGTGNRLTSDGIYNYEYDNEGNLIKQTEIATGNIREFEWNYRNRLVKVTDKNSEGTADQAVEFTYDALDRRIAKEVDVTPEDANDGVVTHFVYDRDNVLLDFVDNDGAIGANQPVLDKRYLYGNQVDQVLAEEDDINNVVWYLVDHLGSTRDLVNNSGVAINHFIYNSFGSVIFELNSLIDSRYLFTGREFDSEIELYHYRTRYYNSTIGRFLSEDTIGFNSGGTNLYSYVLNTPTNLIDPNGTEPCCSQDPSPSLLECLGDCTADQLGITTLLGAAGVGAGLPIIPKRFVTPGSSPGTSIASAGLSRLFPQRLPTRIWAPTFTNPLARTAVVGRALGRWVPILGWGLLAWDAYNIAKCVADCQDKGGCDE